MAVTAARPTTRNQFPTINAIVAQVVPNGKDEIFYPIFPSHFMMPLKAGEMVWVCYPEAQTGGGSGTASQPMGLNVEREMNENRAASDTEVISNVRGSTGGPAMFRRALVVGVYLSHDQVMLASQTTTGLPEDKGGFWISRTG